MNSLREGVPGGVDSACYPTEAWMWWKSSQIPGSQAIKAQAALSPRVGSVDMNACYAVPLQDSPLKLPRRIGRLTTGQMAIQLRGLNSSRLYSVQSGTPPT